MTTLCYASGAALPASAPAATPSSKYAVAATVKAAKATLAPISFIEGSEFPTGRFIDEDGNRAIEFYEHGNRLCFERNLEVPTVSGRYATNGNLYTEMTHAYAGERAIPVTYYWVYDGKNLTFQLYGQDVLGHRKTCYDGQTYVKSE